MMLPDLTLPYFQYLNLISICFKGERVEFTEIRYKEFKVFHCTAAKALFVYNSLLMNMTLHTLITIVSLTSVSGLFHKPLANSRDLSNRPEMDI